MRVPKTEDYSHYGLVLPELLPYTARILPGLLLIGVCFALAREPLLRIVALVLGFVLIRDAMTPLGFWRIGTSGPAPWLRFADDAGLLLVFGAVTLLLTAAVLRLDGELRALVRWGRPITALAGLGGGLLIAGPVLLLSLSVPVAERGGPVAAGLLPALLFFALAGNLAEEVLFRGLLQGYLERSGPVRAALLSAVMFAACHAYLASTVTDLGWPLLAFTLYEGLICAFLRLRYGVLPAALAHGLAIFLLAAG